jgi:hypothetical protein
MSDTDYKAILKDTLLRLSAIHKQHEQLEVEAAKLRQFFMATLNMLPDSERAQYLNVLNQAGQAVRIRESSLKNAIHTVLGKVYPRYLTATEVRDMLRANGFDFSGYTSNELASVSTTLRRFKPTDAESTTIEGVAAYRAKPRKTLSERIRDWENAIPKK